MSHCSTKPKLLRFRICLAFTGRRIEDGNRNHQLMDGLYWRCSTSITRLGHGHGYANKRIFRCEPQWTLSSSILRVFNSGSWQISAGSQNIPMSSSNTITWNTRLHARLAFMTYQTLVCSYLLGLSHYSWGTKYMFNLRFQDSGCTELCMR